MKYVIAFLAFALILSTIVYYAIEPAPVNTLAAGGNINFHGTEYSYSFVSADNNSIISVYDPNQIKGEEVLIQLNFEKKFFYEKASPILIIKGQNIKALWDNVYFVSQSGKVNSVSYDVIFNSGDVKTMGVNSMLNTDKILEYMESRSDIFE